MQAGCKAGEACETGTQGPTNLQHSRLVKEARVDTRRSTQHKHTPGPQRKRVSPQLLPDRQTDNPCALTSPQHTKHPSPHSPLPRFAPVTRRQSLPGRMSTASGQGAERGSIYNMLSPIGHCRVSPEMQLNPSTCEALCRTPASAPPADHWQRRREGP